MPALVIGPADDWEIALSALADDHAARRAARGEPTTPAAAQSFAVRRLDPAFRAARQGHSVTWDPPAGLTSIRARWTCVRCGATVLVSADGRIYGRRLGSAAQPCPGGG